MKTLALLLISLLALTGCSDYSQKPQTTPAQASSLRIQIIEASEFSDARGSPRSVLLVKDTKTGREFVAISGCGVTELVTESDGKHTHTVEK